MSKQPEAIRLADEIEGSVNNPQLYWQGKAASTLRHLHAVNAELLKLVKRYRAETPLGHQPNMIAHEADAIIAKAGGAS